MNIKIVVFLLGSLFLNTGIISQKLKYFNFDIEDGLPSPQVYSSYEDHYGYIWFSTDRGMCRFNGAKFETFTTKHGLENITNFQIYPTKGDTFWVNSINGSLSFWDGQKFNKFKFNEKIKKNLSLGHRWLSILNIEDHKLSFYIQSIWGEEIVFPEFFHTIDINTGIISKMPFHQVQMSPSTPNYTRFHLSGLNIYQSKKDSLYFNKLKTYVDVFSNFNFAIIDRLDNIFIGTSKGLTILPKNNASPFKILKNAAITSIQESSKGGIWITTLGKGVYYLPSIKIQKMNLSVPNMKDEMFNEVSTADGTLSFLSNKNIVFELDSSDHTQIYSFPNLSFNLKSNRSFFNKKLSYGNEIKIHTSHFKLNDNKPYNKRTLCAAEDSLHNVWVGTIDNLYYHNLLDTSNIFHLQSLPINQKNIRIAKLMSDVHGLWITTLNNGLFYKFNNGNFIKIDSDKLLSTTIHSIFLDKSTLYIATNRGLNILNYQIKNDQLVVESIQSFNSSSGILSDFILDITKWKDKIWLTTNKGICFFHPNDILNNSYFPNLFIKGISVNHQLIKNNLLETKNNNIEIQFEAPTIIYLPPEKYRYKYRLDNKKWAYTNTSNVNYNELEYGNHLFEIQCSNLTGEWSDSKKLEFFIAFPFYEKTWFRALLTLLIVFLAWITIRYRENILKQKAIKDLSYKEIELGILRNQINPHFTFNSLNMIQNYIFANEPVKANEHLGKLSHLIRSGLELSRLKSIPIGVEVDFISSYLALEKERFRNKFEYKIIIDSDLRKSNIEIPPLLTQPIVENILKHAFKKINVKGNISIHYKIIIPYLEISIVDDGIGFDVSKNISDQSLGLDITNRRIEILNEINQNNSSISIDSQLGIGTTVVLKIPIKQ